MDLRCRLESQVTAEGIGYSVEETKGELGDRGEGPGQQPFGGPAVDGAPIAGFEPSKPGSESDSVEPTAELVVPE